MFDHCMEHASVLQIPQMETHVQSAMLQYKPETVNLLLFHEPHPKQVIAHSNTVI